MEDKSISEAVELLYKGAKMLAHHCNECGMPLFQYEGKILCPSCKKLFKLEEDGAVPVNEEKSLNKVEKEKCEGKEDKERIEKEKKVEVTSINENINVIKSVMLSKLYELLSSLNECKDINYLDNILDISIKMLYILEKINKFNEI